MNATGRRSPRAPVLLLALALGGCGEGGARDAATPSPSVEPPAPARPRATGACAVDAASIPALPAFDGAPEGSRRLVLEPLESPALGRCVALDELLLAAREEGPTIVAVRGEGAARELALHLVRDVATLAGTPFVLAAGDAGLYLHDAATMTRLARLHDARASAVAVSPSGAVAAVLLERPRIAGGDATRHTLVVFDARTLEVLAEVDRAPGGRLRFAPDGARLVLASPERAVWVFDVEARSVTRFAMEDPVADAAFAPDRPAVIAIASDANEVRFHDVAADRAIAQSAGAALRTRRDLNTVAFIEPSGLVVAGGDDDAVHVYRGMLGERAEEVAQVALDGNVEDVACCRGERYVVGTSRGTLAWLERGEEVESSRALVAGLLGGSIRLALHDDAVVAAFLGELFRWPGGDVVTAAPCASGDLLASDAGEADVLAVIRIGANLAVHRVTGGSRPEAPTQELGRLPWADATRILRSGAGARAILGLDRDGVQVAFVDPNGALTTAVGPGMDLDARHEVREVADGRFAIWDRNGMVYEVDVPAKTWRLVGRVDAPAEGMRIGHHPRRGYEATFEGSRRRAAVRPPPETPTPTPASLPGP